MQILANQQKMSLQNMMFIICQDLNYCLNVYQLLFAVLNGEYEEVKTRRDEIGKSEESHGSYAHIIMMNASYKFCVKYNLLQINLK